MMTSILFLGQDPDTIDFSKPDVPPIAPDQVRAGTKAAREKLQVLGYDVEWCLTDGGEHAADIVEGFLRQKTFACVVIGAGVRVPPGNLALFESIINAVHRHAPDARIAFNTRPDDSVEAALRWVGR